MKKQDKTKQRLLSEAREMAKGLRGSGMIDLNTTKKIDALCLSQNWIKAIKSRE